MPEDASDVPMSEESSALVEITAIEEIVNITRIIHDELVELVEMMKKYSEENSDIGKLYERIRNIKNKGEENYLRVMQYLVKSSEIALYVPIYINIVRHLDRIIQQVDAVAYRMYLARENKVIIEKGVLETFIKLVELEKTQLESVEEALSKLKVSSKIVLEKLERVFNVEEEIDTIFRKSLFEVYGKYAGYIPALLLLKDIFEHLEEISDLLKNVGEEIRYLALSRKP